MNGWFALLSFAVGFTIAQLTAFAIGLVREHKRPKDLKTLVQYLMQPGGMPSGHSASMTSLTTYLGMMAGFDSGLFALAAATTIVIAYDAIHVRYAVGEQGKSLNRLLKSKGEQPLRLYEGHTLSEVIAGVLLGVVVGAGMGFLTGT